MNARYTYGIVIVLVLVLAIGWYYYDKTHDTTESFQAVPPIYPDGTPSSRFYGEDNPVLNYYSKLEKYGSTLNGIDSGSLMRELENTNTVSKSDISAHKFYVTSNAMRYPIQQAGEPEMRVSKNGWVAGTRALYPIYLSPDESQIPDKPEIVVTPPGAAPIPGLH